MPAVAAGALRRVARRWIPPGTGVARTSEALLALAPVDAAPNAGVRTLVVDPAYQLK